MAFSLAPPTVAAPDATIEGVVTNDKRVPVEAAHVQLIVDRPHYFIREDLAALAEAVTDTNGRFKLDAVSSVPVALLAWGKDLRRTKFAVNVDTAAGKMVGLALGAGSQITGKVIDENGRPLAGAQVGPLQPGIDVEQALAQKVIADWTQTAADGTFTFESILPEVTCHFLVKYPGKQTEDVSARAGATNADVKLRRGGSTLRGQLFSKNLPGSTFQGLPVRLNGNGFDDFSAANSDGSFSYSGVPPGSYSIEALLSFGWEARILRVTLPEDSNTTIDLEVSSGFYVNGTAVDAETSQPAAGVTIAANDSITTSAADGHFSAGPLWTSGPVNVTVPDGSGFVLEREVLPLSATGFDDINDVTVRVHRRRFLKVSIPNIEATTAAVTIHVLSPSQPELRERTTTMTTEVALFRRGSYVMYGDSGNLVSNMATARVGTEREQQINLQLQPAATLRGKIQFGDARETTRSRTFLVRVKTADNVTSSVLVSQTGCAKDGTFVFPVLPAGKYTVEASNSSNTRRQSEEVQVRAGENPPVSFDFSAGRSFTGIVKSWEGTPVPAVRLQCVMTLPNGANQATALDTDENGRFSAEDLEAVKLASVQISHFGFAPYRRNDIALPAENFEIVLKEGRSLRIKVNAPPTSSWRLDLMRTDAWGSGMYPEQFLGRLAGQKTVSGGEVMDILPQNDARFRIVAVGESNQIGVSDPFTWNSEAPLENVITITPGSTGKLSGHLQSTGHESVEIIATNTTLAAGTNAQTEYKLSVFGQDFEFSSLLPGDYLVQAGGSSSSAASTNVDVRADATTKVTLSQEELAQVQGTVVLGKAPVAGAEVELVSQTDQSARKYKTRSDASGAFSFEDVPPDNYLVRASATAGSAGSQRVHKEQQLLISRDKAPQPVTLDLTPPPLASFVPPAELALKAGSDVSLANTETHEIVKMRWNGERLEGQLPAGSYDVWRGDETVGRLQIDSRGEATIQAK